MHLRMRWCSLVLALLFMLLQVGPIAALDDLDAALRDEAISKLPQPLEEMSIKQLRTLIQERGADVLHVHESRRGSCPLAFGQR